MANFFSLYGDRLFKAVYTHLYFVVVSVAIGFVIALVLGVVLSRFPKGARICIPLLSIFQTIPGIVFVGILFIYLGMTPQTVIIALSIYAIFPILKNTYVGIIEVPQEYKDAARGCGMSAFQALVKVEIPLALPSIISGLRLSTVYTVSWAVLAAMIGEGGFGDFIYPGIASMNNKLILGGAIPAAIMAVILSILIDLLKRKLIPTPLRGDRK